MKNQFWIVVWAGLWNKRVWADYEQLLRPVFHFFGVKKKNLKKKHHSVCTEKLHWKKVKKKKSKNPYFFRAKNAIVSTLRSGTDYCWLYCGPISILVKGRSLSYKYLTSPWVSLICLNISSNVQYGKSHVKLPQTPAALLASLVISVVFMQHLR